MLRVHFTAEDLARVKVATELDPMWETMLGVQQLRQGARGVPDVQAWRRRARSVIGEGGPAWAVRMLSALLPARGYFPDFLTPTAAEEGLGAGLEAVRGLPPGRLRRELGQLSDGTRRQPRTAPTWVRNLADGDRDRMSDLTDNRAAISSRIVDRDLRLAGRGLRLIPSYFCRRTPIALADPQLRPVLVYPIDHSACRTVMESSGTTPQALAVLLGRTRARTLAALHDTATTGELARRLRISPASASQHVHAPAAAGLARSHRVGSQVLHTLTPLGEALLSGRLPSDGAVT